MIFDALALAVLAGCALLGARRGTLAAAVSVAGLAGAYAASLAASAAFGPDVAARLASAPALGAAAAAVAGFAAAALALALAAWALRLWDARRRGGAPRTPLDRAGGAALGAARGAILALGIGLLAVWADAWGRLAPGAAGEAPAPLATPLRAATQRAIEVGATALADGPVATVTARVLARPSEALAGLRALAEQPLLAALAQDAAFWADVESGALDFALARPTFQAVAREPALRAELAALGLVDDATAADPALFRRELRGVLAALGPHLERLRADPELQRLAADPQVAALAERGDVVGLLRHPGFQRLVAHVLASAPEGAR